MKPDILTCLAAGLLTDIALKSCILVCLAALLLLAMRSATAASRHLICLLTLAGLLFLPLLERILPAWRIPVGPLFKETRLPVSLKVRSGPAASGITPLIRRETKSSPVRLQVSLPTSGISVKLPAAPAGSEPSFGNTAAEPPSTKSAILPVQNRKWPLVVVSLWGVGAAVMLLRCVLALVTLWRLKRRCLQADAGDLRALVQEEARRCRCRRPVTLLLTGPGTALIGPVTWGWRRPVILMPAGARQWPCEQQRTVVLHELGHIGRKDCLWQCLASFACILYWFHPLVWLLSRQLQRESEYACDDFVIRAGIPPAVYANHLVEILRAMKTGRNLSYTTAIMGNRSHIEKRIVAILQRRGKRAGLSLGFLYLSCGVSLGILVPLAMAAPTPNAPAKMSALQPLSHHTAALPARSEERPGWAVTPGSDRRSGRAPQVERKLTNLASPALVTPLRSGTCPTLQDLTTPSISQPEMAHYTDRIVLPVMTAQAEPSDLRPSSNVASHLALTVSTPHTYSIAPNRVGRPKQDQEQDLLPPDIDPRAKQLLDQMTAAYRALRSFSASIEQIQEPQITGLTHAEWTILYKKPNRAIITCKDVRGPTRLLSDGSDLYVFANLDYKRYAKLPLQPDGSDFWGTVDRSSHGVFTLGLDWTAGLMAGIDIVASLRSDLRSVTLGQPEVIDGVPTETVTIEIIHPVRQPFGGSRRVIVSNTVTLAIGTEDHLVRRIISGQPNQPGKTQHFAEQTFKNIKVDPPLSDDTFAVTPPPDKEEVGTVAELGDKLYDRRLKPGAPAFDFTARDTQGRNASLAQHRGKVLLLWWNVMGSSAPLYANDMAALYNRYHGQGFDIVGIWGEPNSNRQRSALAAWLKQHHITWPQILDGPLTYRSSGPLFNLYGVKGIPMEMLIGPDGKVILPDVPALEVLEYEIRKALKQQ